MNDSQFFTKTASYASGSEYSFPRDYNPREQIITQMERLQLMEKYNGISTIEWRIQQHGADHVEVKKDYVYLKPKLQK